MSRDVDAVVLALSDAMVMVALERAFSRTRAGSARRVVSPAHRHSDYTQHPIAVERIEYALTDAWTLIPILAARNRLDVDVALWIDLLNSYVATLLMSCQPHVVTRLRQALSTLMNLDVTADPEIVTMANSRL